MTVEKTVPRPAAPLNIREYPGMRIVSMFFYVLAAMNAGFGVLLLILIWTSSLWTLAETSSASSVIYALVASGMVVLFTGIVVAALVFVAEAIKIMIDIQENTQRAAHFAER